MVSLKLQKRLTTSLLNFKRRIVWLNPNEVRNISIINSPQNIRKLVNDGFIFKKPMKINSRSHARFKEKEKRMGCHSGYGKHMGTREARLPMKVLWMRRMRVLRCFLRKYREAKKIDKRMCHDMNIKVKGNVFKNKRVLRESINKSTREKARENIFFDQFEAKRAKSKVSRENKIFRNEECLAQMLRALEKKNHLQ
ncbi:60S ribosomal protein L19-3-like [Dendrobium catenatum]|uniref:60S ribosomal protein L19-3-like n=1 Tax=Dendrobium catenatum TaxID=906689 RepID=UPI0009F3E03F|nr:60S ribosomal protein L19-3-like [Dendrobium catenatum]